MDVAKCYTNRIFSCFQLIDTATQTNFDELKFIVWAINDRSFSYEIHVDNIWRDVKSICEYNPRSIMVKIFNNQIPVVNFN